MADGPVIAAKSGSLSQLQTALSAPAHDVNRTDKDGCSALHHALWRNHLPIIRLLLDSGASMEQRDAESGWTPLHRALYFGHIQGAALLLQQGASSSSSTTDFQGRTALDLLSGELAAQARPRYGETFAWGHGANYQLGSGALGFQSTPVRLEELHGRQVIAVAASKFHSAALTADGRLYTWGFGRGGRLGHPEFDIHSGKSAVITPRPVDAFSRARVKAIAVSKHHSAAVLCTGELYTWGSNRDGRLGYTAVDSQPTPRRVGSLKGVSVACVAAANRHTVAAAADGRIFTWGSNLQGQLGYGTSDSASNATPRIVEVLKGREVVSVSAAKRHTLVLTSAGEVLTWGHRFVTPRKVQFAGVRDVARAPVLNADPSASTPPPVFHSSSAGASTNIMPGGSSSSSPAGGEWQVVFHRDKHHVARPVAVAIAAGAAHSCVVTAAGTVLAWRSMDPNLQAVEVGGSLAGKAVAYIDAGKYRTAAVTRQGDIYLWEGWSKAAEVPSSAERAASHTPAKQRLSKSSSNGAALAAPAGTPDRPASKPGKAAVLADQGICPVRVEGVKQVAAVAVGEKHSLALQCWRPAPAIPLIDAASPLASASHSPSTAPQLTSPRPSSSTAAERQEEQDWIAAADGLSEAGEAYGLFMQPSALISRASGSKAVPSLQRLCEATVARHLVEPRTALQLLEFAEAAGASALFEHCLEVAVGNMDVVLMEAQGVLEGLPESTLLTLEQALQARCGPRPTAYAPAAGKDGSFAAHAVKASSATRSPTAISALSQRLSGESSFAEARETPEAAAMTRHVRTLKKKLQQIDVLLQRLADSPEAGLDAQQHAKVCTRAALQAALDASENGATPEEVQQLMTAALAPLTEAQRSRCSIASETGVRAKAGNAARRGELMPAKENTPSNAVGFGSRPWDEMSWGQGSRAADSSVSAPARPDANIAAVEASRQRSWADMAGSWRSPEPPAQSGAGVGGRDRASALSPARPAPRKGGLSLFLSGELERSNQAASSAPQAVPSAPPAWKSSIPAASLRHIQSMEAAAASVRSQREASADDAEASDNPSAVPLSQYMRSSAPIPMAPKAKSPAAKTPAPEARPAWRAAALGSSPPGVTFKDIQAQQEQHRDSLSRSWGAAGASPNSRAGFMAAKSPPWHSSQSAAGAGGTSPGPSFPIGGSSPGAAPRRLQGFTPAAQPQSKWYIQEQQAVTPLSSIQTEETAIKEQSAVSMQMDRDAETLFTIDEAELPHRPNRGAPKKSGEQKKPARRRPRASHDSPSHAQSAPLPHDPAHAEAAPGDQASAKPRHRHRRRHPKGADSARGAHPAADLSAGADGAPPADAARSRAEEQRGELQPRRHRPSRPRQHTGDGRQRGQGQQQGHAPSETGQRRADQRGGPEERRHGEQQRQASAGPESGADASGGEMHAMQQSVAAALQ